MSTLARIPGRKGHGHHIYAYCNIRTNQVLYSLERTLSNSNLKQLADAGANNNPPKLRKDLWRPLFAVHLPPTSDGQRQGLELFRHLREYRMLHETNWELPEEIMRPYTKKEIEEMQTELDNRGGSKKETVYDVIKQKKKKMRQKMVMDQKANSIADLAHILLKQETMGAEIVEGKKRVSEAEKSRTIKQIQLLSNDFEEGRWEALRENHESLTAKMREAKRTTKDKQFTVKQRKAAAKSFLALREQARQIKLQIDKMEWSHKAMKEANEQADEVYKDQLEKERGASAAEGEEKVDTTLGETVSVTPRETPPSQDATSAASTETPDGTTTTPSPTQLSKPRPDPLDFLPSFPPHLDHISAASQGAPLPETRPGKATSHVLSIIRSPVYSVSDISIQWANCLDAEFAAEWPTSVRHDWMGFVRHSVPAKGMQIAEDVNTWKGQQWKGREPNWTVEETTSQEGKVQQQETAIGPVSEGGNLITAGAAEENAKEAREKFLQELKEGILEDVRSGHAAQNPARFLERLDRERAQKAKDERYRLAREKKQARARMEAEEMSRFVAEEIAKEERGEPLEELNLSQVSRKQKEEMNKFVGEEIAREENGSSQGETKV